MIEPARVRRFSGRSARCRQGSRRSTLPSRNDRTIREIRTVIARNNPGNTQSNSVRNNTGDRSNAEGQAVHPMHTAIIQHSIEVGRRPDFPWKRNATLFSPTSTFSGQLPMRHTRGCPGTWPGMSAPCPTGARTLEPVCSVCYHHEFVSAASANIVRRAAPPRSDISTLPYGEPGHGESSGECR